MLRLAVLGLVIVGTHFALSNFSVPYSVLHWALCVAVGVAIVARLK